MYGWLKVSSIIMTPENLKIVYVWVSTIATFVKGIRKLGCARIGSGGSTGGGGLGGLNPPPLGCQVKI